VSGSLEADVDRLLAEHPGHLQDIERALRAVIRSEVPEAVEWVDFPDRLIGYGFSMKMADLLFALIAHKAHVNLQLADGAVLPDPTGIVEGTGKRVRHVKIRSVEAARSDAVLALIRAEVAMHSGTASSS